MCEKNNVFDFMELTGDDGSDRMQALTSLLRTVNCPLLIWAAVPS